MSLPVVPTREPEQLGAATSWTWRRDDLGLYPASTWTLRYYFRSTTANVTFDAAADGSGFLVERTVAQTTSIAAGRYAWQALVVNGSQQVEVGRGTLTVLPSLADTSVDPRSHAQKTLDAVEALLESRASRADQDYQISVNGTMRRLASFSHKDLLAFRNQYRAEVRAERERDRIAQGAPGRRRVLTRFVRST